MLRPPSKPSTFSPLRLVRLHGVRLVPQVAVVAHDARQRGDAPVNRVDVQVAEAQPHAAGPAAGGPAAQGVGGELPQRQVALRAASEVVVGQRRSVAGQRDRRSLREPAEGHAAGVVAASDEVERQVARPAGLAASQSRTQRRRHVAAHSVNLHGQLHLTRLSPVSQPPSGNNYDCCSACARFIAGDNRAVVDNRAFIRVFGGGRVFRRQIFRDEAAARQGRAEPLDGLLRVTAPREWAALLLALIAAFSTVGWGIFGSIERSVSTGCVLVESGQRFAVLSRTSGNVVEVLVDVGDQVASGQSIARIRNPELDHQVETAQIRVDILKEVDETGGDALAVARADLQSLKARQAAGEHIATPFAGTVTAHGLVPGQAVALGSEVAAVRGPGDGQFEVLGLVAHQDAVRLGAGMKARVVTGGGPGDVDASAAFEAGVVAISELEAPAPDWLTRLGGGAIAQSGHLVTLRLADSPDARIADGERCRVRITVSRDRPIRLIAQATVADFSGTARL